MDKEEFLKQEKKLEGQKRLKDLEAQEESLNKLYSSPAAKEKLKPGDRKRIVEEKLKYLEGAAMTMQNELVSWQKKHAKFFTECLELYKVLNKPDTLFDDSPLSTHTMHRWLRLFLIKKDMSFMAKETHWLDNPKDIPDFLQKTKELRNWALKFAKDDGPEKSGEEKILS